MKKFFKNSKLVIVLASCILSILGNLSLFIIAKNEDPKGTDFDSFVAKYDSDSEGTQAELPETGEGDLNDINKGILLTKPGVVQIFNRSCAKLNIEYDPDVPNLSGKSYNLCSLSIGTGFFVNKEGIMATNAHVACPNETDLIVDAIMYGYDKDGFYKNFLDDSGTYYSNRDYSETDWKSELYSNYYYLDEGITGMILLGIEDGVISISDVTYENYIQTDNLFEYDTENYSLINKEENIETEVVDYREIDSYYEISYKLVGGQRSGIKKPDLALIKIVDSDLYKYPVLELANPNNISTGQSINVIGFPGAAMNETIFSKDSSNIPTITKGTISAIKDSYVKNFKILQIDASISFGNSGGPIINNEGNVLGIATYGLDYGGSGDFNAGVSVEELLNLMADNGISNESGEVMRLILSGIDNIESNYFKWAIQDFNEAIEITPSLKEDLYSLIVIAEKKIAEGEDNTPLFKIGGINIHRSEMVLFCIGSVIMVTGIVLFVVFIIILIIARARKKKKRK